MMRSSATYLYGNAELGEIIRCVEEMLRERMPFRRIGYPRAGGYDRLTIAIASEVGEKIVFRILVPRWRGTSTIVCSVQGRLSELLVGTEDKPSSVVFCGARGLDGDRKYGTERNMQFGNAEVAIFLDSLHRELCSRGVANRIHGGILDPGDIGMLVMPWRMKSVLALVA